MKFRPCIDLHGGRVKQIVGNTLNDKDVGLVENFVSDKDAAYFADLFKRDSIPGGHVIMLGKGNDEQAIKALNTYPGGLQVGGGITPDNAKTFLNEGASHVIVTSYIFQDGKIDIDRLNKMLSTVGKDRIVVDISCKKKDDTYFVVLNRWQQFSNFEITATNISSLEKYCSELLVHAVDVEGKRSGPDEELIDMMGRWISLPSTYAGGVRSFDDLENVRALGKNRVDVTIGSALDIFGGQMPYSAVINWFRENK